MEQTNFKVYGYRWIVLLAFMFVVSNLREVEELPAGLIKRHRQRKPIHSFQSA